MKHVLRNGVTWFIYLKEHHRSKEQVHHRHQEQQGEARHQSALGGEEDKGEWV